MCNVKQHHRKCSVYLAPACQIYAVFSDVYMEQTKRTSPYLGIGHGTSPEDAPSTLRHVVVDALVLSVEVAWTKENAKHT